ncbi:symmetrical bis(5'-nucleosyl)-tetraphosphatase [Photobacterium aphoticum]|uniref:Bis(5'-nucleosyl)-tetraphosphatase, symmetrical n=1 Tax=Photobacterium aphoticum TaxID=754436 RepID=A0A0J1GH04_9GAMM|nr:symmetrical bis(5'-nucleosyl)-tetraphosphatase [Photobacterium aphoticum]KLU98768.1 bis(5'-nucleosyl)-tetraphosphatase [Photobacterium aphoticum]PSU55415.1 symmetrical bis(5'-nucleosyl)-tetraphosphatase [Photobacterium aphoticum]GHA65236.1 bis(5'-nucleosyl)-tetraphosphatase, symmetrical [Photobacterium aphoticum]
MSTYLVGDIQGCLDDLQVLLDTAQFNPAQDTLWLTGDLVARGPRSLDTLRFVHQLGDRATTVLGNHDLHLLAVAHGIARNKPRDKLQPILDAPDRDALMHWLRHQPLLAEHPEHAFVMTHAGLPPQWTLEQARAYAREVEAVLQSDRYLWLLENMYGNGPDQWDPSLTGIERYRFIINAFTRMRFCYPDGRLDMDCKLAPEHSGEAGLIPWFQLERPQIDKKMIFGHWAALMGYEDENVIGLDTGCVWGNSMTLLRWEDGARFEHACPIHAD